MVERCLRARSCVMYFLSLYVKSRARRGERPARDTVGAYASTPPSRAHAYSFLDIFSVIQPKIHIKHECERAHAHSRRRRPRHARVDAVIARQRTPLVQSVHYTHHAHALQTRDTHQVALYTQYSQSCIKSMTCRNKTRSSYIVCPTLYTYITPTRTHPRTPWRSSG